MGFLLKSFKISEYLQKLSGAILTLPLDEIVMNFDKIYGTMKNKGNLWDFLCLTNEKPTHINDKKLYWNTMQNPHYLSKFSKEIFKSNFLSQITNRFFSFQNQIFFLFKENLLIILQTVYLLNKIVFKANFPQHKNKKLNGIHISFNLLGIPHWKAF